MMMPHGRMFKQLGRVNRHFLFFCKINYEMNFLLISFR